MEDAALLQEYARTESEPAFAALVERYAGLVYSAALRQVGDSHLAQDITQTVFLVLAHKAGQLSRHQVLSGWLLKATHYATTTQIRAARRRSQREQEAYMQSTLNEPAPSAWEEIAPLLDEAMASLGDADRNVLALRFFENKTAHDIGRLLKLNEEAAQKRVSRALVKLRKFFAKRGVVLATTVIASAVAANCIRATPAGLAEAVTATVAKSATISTAVTTLAKETMQLMAWLKIKLAATAGLSVLLVAGVATVAISRTKAGDKSAARNIVSQTNAVHRTLSSKNAKTNVPALTLAEILKNTFSRLQTPAAIRNELLQKLFLQFPLLRPVTNSNGQPAFETLTLKNPALIQGTKYFGFRFKVPRRKGQKDFVWSFVLPDCQTMKGWYILPRTGNMEGFGYYFWTERNVFPAEDTLLPANGNRLVLQSLSGANLEEGKTYLIWFGYKGWNPVHMSVAFAFANLRTNRLNAIAKALALNRQDYLKHPLSPSIENPENHHLYILLRPATWKASEKEAEALGGHLATVRNREEEDWIFKTFGSYGGMQHLLWIGLSDREKKFHFSWADGESVSYTDWAKREPNNAGHGEDYVAIYYPNHSEANQWNDWNDRSAGPIGLPFDGVVEIIPKGGSNGVAAAASTRSLTANAVAVSITPMDGEGLHCQHPLFMKTPDLSQAPIVKRYGIRGAKLFAMIWFPIFYVLLVAITAGLWIVNPAFAGGWRRIFIGCVIGVLVVTAASLLTRMRLKFLEEIKDLETQKKTE